MVTETNKPLAKSWLFPRVWGAFLLLLVMLTYRLWFIPSTASAYLTIPLLSFLSPPGGVNVLPSITLVLSLFWAIFLPNRRGWAWWFVAGSLTIAFLLDQHRLQPWAYQSVLYAVIFASTDAKRGRQLIIPLAASIYIYSAAGKFDYQFAHTVGQDFLRVIANPLGGIPADLDESVRVKLALLFPSTELIAGLGLLIPKTRRIAAVVLICMHLSLIVILGPWCLHHSRGVLIWNAMLIVQAAMLMIWRPSDFDPTSNSAVMKNPADLQRPHLTDVSSDQFSSKRPARIWLARCVVMFAIAAPLFERSGYWDHWTSWSLYSPHTSRVDIELHQSVIAELSPTITEHLSEDEDRDGWRRLAIESWSLASRSVPVYPQSRYQLIMAAEMATENGWDDQIRVRLRGVADRWTGKRTDKRLLGGQQLSNALTEFWLTRGGG